MLDIQLLVNAYRITKAQNVNDVKKELSKYCRCCMTLIYFKKSTSKIFELYE